jgi:hypothetical protein
VRWSSRPRRVGIGAGTGAERRRRRQRDPNVGYSVDRPFGRRWRARTDVRDAAPLGLRRGRRDRR